MDQDTEYVRELMTEYSRDVAPLLRYLPWLRKATENSAVTMYKGQGAESEGMLSFPVYDSTLMSFVKTASATPLMDRNYPYVYTRRNIKTAEQERNLIASCTYKEWDVLRGILSRYVLGGRTKGVLWSQGVSENIFCLVLEKMDAILAEWDSERTLS